MSDNGTQFFWDDKLTQKGIKILYTAIRHPKSNKIVCHGVNYKGEGWI